MRIRLHHLTQYDYDPPARSIIQILRMTPRSHAHQQVRDWRIETNCDALLRPGQDSFGNIVHTLYADGPFDTFVVEAVGTVQTDPSNGVLEDTFEPLPTKLFTRDTALTKPTREMESFARDSISSQDGLLDQTHALMLALYERMTFDTSTTTVTTTAKQAFEKQTGVCQDYAHIFLTCCRSLDIPARYVSGYLHMVEGHTNVNPLPGAGALTKKEPGKPEPDDAVMIQEASHGWTEVHIEGLGWVAFDPANGVSANDLYVRVAVGLDYLDANPVRGTRTGGGNENLKVEVTVDPSKSDLQFGQQ